MSQPNSLYQAQTLIELPDVMQSIAQTGRDGVLQVSASGQRCEIHFKSGAITAISSRRKGRLIRAIIWTGLLSHRQIIEAGLADYETLTSRECAERLLQGELIPSEGILDAIDCHIEESFTEIFSWRHPKYEMLSSTADDDWANYQIERGTNIPVAGLLIEALRRQDELRRLEDLIPSRWDLLKRTAKQLPEDLNDSQRSVIRSWRDGRPAGAVIELAGVPPWLAKHALASLIEGGWFDLGEVNDLVIQADQAIKSEQPIVAEGFYRRAIDAGCELPRVFLALASINEDKEKTSRAIKYYLHAAKRLEAQTPEQAVVAYRHIHRLNGDPEMYAARLAELYEQVGEKDDALDQYLAIADVLIDKKDYDQAKEFLRAGLALEVNEYPCRQQLARVALAENDQDEARLHLQQAITVANRDEDLERRMAAEAQLLTFAPYLSRYAVPHARTLFEQGNSTAAREVLHQCLQSEQRKFGEQQETTIRQLLAEIDPADSENNNWLAEIYQASQDRDQAQEHLQRLADQFRQQNDERD